MEFLIPVVIVLAIIAFALGHARDRSLARKIGEEVGAKQPPTGDDPIVLLEKLHRLQLDGALTDEEYERQKKRLLES